MLAALHRIMDSIPLLLSCDSKGVDLSVLATTLQAAPLPEHLQAGVTDRRPPLGCSEYIQGKGKAKTHVEDRAGEDRLLLRWICA